MIRLAVAALGVTAFLSLSASAQDDGQVYRIRSKLTSKVLAPDAGGKLLVQQSPKGKLKDEALQWKLVKAKEGNFFQIVNVESGKALTAPSKDALAQVAIESNADGKPKAGQLWSFEKGDNGFTIQSRLSGYYLDVFNFETEDGVKVIQQELNPNKAKRGNQQWELVPVKAK
jgi:hypothetical protein